jgi:hypothetical protein
MTRAAREILQNEMICKNRGCGPDPITRKSPRAKSAFRLYRQDGAGVTEGPERKKDRETVRQPDAVACTMTSMMWWCYKIGTGEKAGAKNVGCSFPGTLCA